MRHGIADAHSGLGSLGFYSLPVASRCIAALPAFPSHHSTYRITVSAWRARIAYLQLCVYLDILLFSFLDSLTYTLNDTLLAGL